jgi:twitching motility two-component system response regulator PilH
MKRFTLKNLFTRTSSASTIKERRKRKRPANGYNVTILVVDDSRTVIAAFQKVLRQAGFRVLTAMNGQEGIAVAKAKKPDLILMDVVMPGINGFQATRYLRQQPATCDIPIIIVSGEQQATEQFWGKRVGANGFMTKPVDRGVFFSKIFELLDKKKIAVG